MESNKKPKLSSEASKHENSKLEYISTLYTVEELQKYYAEFMKSINQIKSEIANENRRLEECQTESSGISVIGDIETMLADLKLKFNNTSMFLVSHDRQNYLKHMDDAELAIVNLKELAAPKKKFKFKSKGASHSRQNEVKSTVVTEEKRINIYSKDDLIISAEKGKVLIVSDEELIDKKNLLLENIEDSEIIILGSFKSLFAKGISRSSVFVGAVSGGSHLTSILNSQIYVSTHQLRIHDSFDTQFSVLVNSNPIIEKSSRLNFASIFACVSYDSMKLLHQNAGLDENINKYSQVQDFQWLKQEKSPNFHIIEGEMSEIKHITKLK